MTAGTIIRPLLLGVLLAVTFSMSCGNISIGTTGFDLSHLNNLTSGSGYLFSFCNPFPVSSQNYLYSTMAAAQYTDANNQLQTMPLTRTSPLIQLRPSQLPQHTPFLTVSYRYSFPA